MTLIKPIRLSLSLCSVFALFELNAQSTASDEEEIFELSPFVIDGSQDVGYKASSSLAGTRLSTKMRDIAASISILNEDFLKDTGSTNIADALLFTPNTEISGPYGNFSGYQSSAGSLIPEGETDRPQGGRTRIRGLSQADLTRNYFNTDVPFDTYNTDRVEVQRGANSALFGIGSPGGIVNTSTIRANLYDSFGRVRYETDEHGTQRGSFRYNHVILEDRLAIRVAGLLEDRKYEQEEAYLDDERVYASLVWKITDGLRFNSSIETGSRQSANPDSTPINDGITPWIQMGKPISMGGAQGSDVWRGTGAFADGVLNNKFLDLAAPGSSSGFVSYFDADSADPFYGGNTFIRKNRGASGGDVTGELMLFQSRSREDIIRRSGLYPDGSAVEAGTSSYYASGFVASQILDRSIFDYKKHLYTGGAHTQDSEWELFEASIDGSWFQDRLGFDLSTYKQEQSSKSSNPLQGLSSRTLVIDPNMYLLNTVDGTADGAMVPNPNFGKPVMGGLWQGNNLGSDRSSTRLTGFAEVRFDDFMDDSLALKILGRVKFTGLVQNRTSHSLESYGRYKIDPVAVTTALEGDAALSYATLRTGSIFGLPHNEGIDYLNINSLSYLQGSNIGAVSYGSDRDRPFQGGTWTGWSQSDNAYVDFPAATYNMDDGNNYPASFYASKRLTKLESKVVVAQHYLWNNGLVLTGTWRNDRQSTASKSAPAGIGGSVLSQADLVNHPTYAIGPRSSDLEESADEDATSWGVTAHLRELIGSEVPDISFYYTDSSNFQPTSGRVNIFNEEIDSVTGSTVEKGIIYDAMEGKLSLRLNKFESGVLNNSFDGGPVSASEGILLGLARELDNAANVAQGFTAANSQSVLPPQGVIDVNGFVPDWANAEASTARNSSDSGSQDYTAEGYELEVAYNPIPQWTTMVGVAKQSTVTSNIFPAMKNYINDFVIPNWVNSDFAKNYYIDELGTETLAERAMRTLVTPVAASLTLEGIPSIEQREWRFNLNTSYHFEEGSGVIPGFLGDFTVGGGYRWEDKVGIGFHVAENEFGQMALDPNNPFYGPKQDFVDLFFRSEYTLKGENTLSVQLNIKDLFDNDDLVPTYANPDGTKVYRFLRGRLVTVSATYGF